MSHLNDKLADFFYEELPATEMVEARRHVAECADCRAQVQLFERTHLAVKSLPDAELPRRVAFAEPERRVAWGVLDWRCLAPMAAAAAALVLAIMPHTSPVPAPTPVAVTAPAPVVPAPVVQPQPIDYDRIADQVRESDRVWLASELAKRDKEIRQLQGQLAYYESYQRTVMKETLENASHIQLLAQRTSLQD